MTWTRFMDMASGGSQKEPPYEYILIEAEEKEAQIIFYNRLGHNPNRVTCTCCGEDYSISENESLEQITAYDRNCAYVYYEIDGTEVPKKEALEKSLSFRTSARKGYVERVGEYGKYQKLENYLEEDTVLVIRSHEIKDSERKGSLPDQGYIWI